MERVSRHNLIKRLLVGIPRGAPFDIATLKRLGITSQAASHYAKEGWLVRIGHGVYAFPNDELTPHGMVKLLQNKIKGLHIGGKSALALQGVRHNLRTREQMVLWGDSRCVLPHWFTSQQPARYVSAKLFTWTDKELSKLTLTTPPGLSKDLLVSSPERSTMELLFDVGKTESLEESRNIFDGLSNLRRDVTGRLLACCSSVKTVRLFLAWARETQIVDVDALREMYPLQVGSQKRWIHRLNDGTLLSLKPYG